MLQFIVAVPIALTRRLRARATSRRTVTEAVSLLLATLLVTLIQWPAVLASAQQHQGMHGHGHDKLHHWYETLQQPDSGYSCCDNKDCRPTTARRQGEFLEVLVDGEWMKVPSKTILTRTSPDMNTHVCAAQLYGRPKVIFCVVLGSGV